ncbi:MAG: ROK family protein [Ardenticatenaceae bacterium]|nr:ROK family protein [Ardenticatenaceae bacterium]
MPDKSAFWLRASPIYRLVGCSFMLNPFQSATPFVSPSLNRVRIAALPGIDLPVEVEGKTGYDLLSAVALAARIQARANELGLPPDAPDLLRRFDGCFTELAEPVEACTISEEIAREYGRSLAYLLLTLKRGDPANRAARKEWDDRHWSFWAGINTVWVGGGLVSGQLGPIAVREAGRVMHDAGFPDFAVNLSPHGADLPLMGLSRLAPFGAQAMLVFDFGGTAVKRAIAEYKDNQFTQLHRLPSWSSPCESSLSVSLELADVAAHAERILSIIEQTWQEAERPLAPTIAVSLACYLQNGQPPPSEMGCYGRLQLPGDNLQTYLADQLSQRLGQPIYLHLYHDGSAAALAYAGCGETAVIMLGTAVGIGFPQTTY